MLPITAELASEALSDDVQIMRLRGIESMNRLTKLLVEVNATGEPLDMAEVLGQPVTLSLVDDGETVARDIGLIISDVRQGAADGDGQQYLLTLVPPEWLLTQHSGYEIFRKKTTQEIVAELLTRAGISGPKVTWSLGGKYAKRVYCTQYGEVAWDFIQRLLAEEGIAYWFETGDDGPTICFGDSKGSHKGLTPSATVPFEEATGLEGARSFFQFEVIDQETHNSVYLREYDKRNPDVLIEGRFGKGGYNWYDYPARVAKNEEAEARAKVRLEQLQRYKRRARGLANCIRLQPGRIAKVIGCADEDMNGEYLVVEVAHSWGRSSRSGQQADPWCGRVLMVPVKEADAPTCRPAIWARRPSIDGTEPAITTGDGGEIHVNDLAEVTLRFPWDRSGITDQTSSDWMRCVNMAMGGTMMLPRVNWEVPVMYYDGDPDRPLVLGRLYNATGVVPYGLPGGAATTALQSATSPGGGSTNEFRMADTAGSQEFFVHATKDQTIFVGNNSTTDVGNDETHDVKLNFDVNVNGAQTCKVGSNQTINVGTKTEVIVGGTRDETVGAIEHTEVSANRQIISKNLYSETIGGLYAMQCNQYNIEVTGAYLQTVAGATAHATALGTSETIVGGRAETVGGLMNLVATKEYGEEVKGLSKKIVAGAHSIKAGGKISAESKNADIKIDCKGSANLKASKDIVFVSGNIEIDCKQLKIGSIIKKGSGTVQQKKKVKADGTIKHKGGTKISK